MNKGDGLSLAGARLPRWLISTINAVFFVSVLLLTYSGAVVEEDTLDGSAGYWMTRGHELYMNGSYQEAAWAYQNATRLDAENASAWLGIAEALKFTTGNEEVLKAADRALQIDGEYADAWISRGYVLSNMGRNSESIEAYQRALDLYERMLDRNGNDSSAWRGKGLALGFLMVNGSYDLTGLDQAIQAFDTALEIDQDDAETYLHKANALWILAIVRGVPDLYNQSLDCLDRAIILYPHYAEAWRIKGTIYQEMGQHEKAVESFDQALMTAPQMTWALAGKAQSLEELDRTEEAEAIYSLAVGTMLFDLGSANSSQEESQAWYQIGTILWRQGKRDEALSAMENATFAYPTDCLAWMAKADMLASTYRYSQSLSAYDGAIRAIEADPEGSICRLSDAYFQRGDVLLAAGRIEQARLAFEEANSLDPESPYIWVARGDCLRAEGLNQDALEAYNRAIEKAETSSSIMASGIAARAWYMSGLTERQLGHDEEADLSMARAADLGFSLPQSMTLDDLVDVGLEHHENGSYDLAVESFHKGGMQEPRNATIWFYKGNSLYALAIDSGFEESIFQAAIDSYNRSIELNQTCAEPWWGMARALDLMGLKLSSDLARTEGKEQALSAIGYALDIDPNYGEGWVFKGSLLDEMGSLTGNTSLYNESIESFNMALEVTAADDSRVLALAWEGKALSLTHIGNHLADMGEGDEARSMYQEALGYYDRAIDLDPDFTGLEARINMASVLEELGRYDDAIMLLNQALAAVPDNLSSYAAMLWADKGQVLYMRGESEEALSALENATSMDPLNAIAWKVKGDVLRNMGQSSKAEEAYSKAQELGLDPLGSMIAIANTTDYWMNKAQELYHNGSIEDAILAYDEALKIDSENETILIRKAFDLMVVGKVNESVETYELALSILEEDLDNDPNDAEAWQDKARVLRSLNRQVEAKEAYDASLAAFDLRIANNSRDADAWMGRANVLLNLGRWDEAHKAYNEVTRLKPLDYNVWWRKAEVISGIGDINESVEAYDKAISLIPANDTAELALAYAAKGEDLAAAGRCVDALEAVNRSLELNPKSGTWWHFKAFILNELDRKYEALAAFDEAIRENHDDVDSWQWKASLLVEMKRYDESLEAYDEAIDLLSENDTEELAVTWLAKGTALNKTGRQQEANEAFQRSLEFIEKAILEDPGDVSLQQMRGRALYELGRYDESLEAYNQILEFSPAITPYLADTNALIGKGDALRALGRNQEALDAYNKAIELGPHWGNAWYGRGESQRALGQVYNASMSFLVADKLGYEE